MKKISAILLSFLSFIVFLVSGCTYADNATLLKIKEKYDSLSKNNTELFYGSKFYVSYPKCTNLQNLITYDSLPEYYNLKLDLSISDYSNRGAYGVLMQAVNTTFLNNSAALEFSDNNKKTSKQYKKAMYLALEDLQKNIKPLLNSKKDLESVFNSDSRDAEIVAKQDLTKYCFNNYIKNLNKCLNSLLDLNRNYNNALINEIFPIVSINDLMYKEFSSIDFDYNNALINNACIVLSNYVLSYDVNIKKDVNADSEIISILKKLLNIQYALSVESITDSEKIGNYKIVRLMENSINENEVVFENIMSTLNSKSDLTSQENLEKVNFINNYKENLINYGNKLIKYLES